MELSNYCMGCMQNKGDAGICPKCGWVEGTQPEMPQHLPPRSILNNRYLIGRVLGQGGFGITYIGLDLTLNTRLAIKEYLPQTMATRYAGDTEVIPYSSASAKENFSYGLQRFLEEARTLALFAENPNIVSVRDYFSANGTAYLVMSYIDGITFKQYIQEHGNRINWEEALGIMEPVMTALEEVHAEGLLHRDISPENIFITKNRQVKILDFGAARYAIGEHSKSLSVILKAGYAPEEQYRGKGQQGPWTDVYATAATIYRAVTGMVPPEALDRIHDDVLQAPSEMGVVLSAAAEAALLKALAVLGSNRFQTMREFRLALTANARIGQVPDLSVASGKRSEAGFEGLDSSRLIGRPVDSMGVPTVAENKPDMKTVADSSSIGQASAPPVEVPQDPGALHQESVPGIAPTMPLPQAEPNAQASASDTGLTESEPPKTGPEKQDRAGEGDSMEPQAVAPSQEQESAAPGWHRYKPALIAAGLVLLVLFMMAGGYGIYQWGLASRDRNPLSGETDRNPANDNNPPPAAKNDIKNIILCESFDEINNQPINTVRQFKNSQKRLNALVALKNPLKDKITGNWYYLGSGQRELISTLDRNGTGIERQVWFYADPPYPLKTGKWEFEVTMPNGASKSTIFDVVPDPILPRP